MKRLFPGLTVLLALLAGCATSVSEPAPTLLDASPDANPTERDAAPPPADTAAIPPTDANALPPRDAPLVPGPDADSGPVTFPEGCATATADCNHDLGDGCEARLDTTLHCGACGRACDVHEECAPAGGVFVCRAVRPPRLLAPWSGAQATTRRPRFRWEHPSPETAATLEVCRDRACARIVETLTSSSGTATPSRDLPVGTLFWRVSAPLRGSTRLVRSATWEVTLGPRSAPVSSSVGALPDFNGDGYTDAVIGAYLADEGVHIYHGGPSGLPRTPSRSLATPTAPAGEFGAVLSAAGDVNGDGYADLVVSDHAASRGSGRFFLYLGSAAGLRTSPSVHINGPAPGANFAVRLSSVGDFDGDGYGDVLVGASGASTLDGRAHIYFGDATGTFSRPPRVLAPPFPGTSNFGLTGAGVGDLDGDGYGDFALGVRLLESPPRVYIYRGGPDARGATPNQVLAPPDGDAERFAQSVVGAGDVNGDGYSDLLVGAPPRLYYGSARGLAEVPDVTVTAPEGASVGFGYYLATAGDANGDGFADVLIADHLAGMSAGRAHLYLGSERGLTTTPALRLDSPAPRGGFFGEVVAGLGDVNGDGRSDLALSATGAGNGRVFLYYGDALNSLRTPPVEVADPSRNNSGAWLWGASMCGLLR